MEQFIGDVFKITKDFKEGDPGDYQLIEGGEDWIVLYNIITQEVIETSELEKSDMVNLYTPPNEKVDFLLEANTKIFFLLNNAGWEVTDDLDYEFNLAPLLKKINNLRTLQNLNPLKDTI